MVWAQGLARFLAVRKSRKSHVAGFTFNTPVFTSMLEKS